VVIGVSCNIMIMEYYLFNYTSLFCSRPYYADKRANQNLKGGEPKLSDGQVVVTSSLLGMNGSLASKFAIFFTHLHTCITLMKLEYYNNCYRFGLVLEGPSYKL